MRLCRRIGLVVASALVVAFSPVMNSFASTEPTIEAAGSYGSFYWNPSTATVAESGSVMLKNSSSVAHGIVWHSLPAGASPPTCGAGVPVYSSVGGVGQTNWSGSCSFSHAGSYVFYCSVHGPSMAGTITVKAPSTPKAVTNEQTGVTQTAATLNGSVSPEDEATSYYFEYGTTAAMPEKIPLTPQSVGSDFAEHPVSATLTNLAPATEYHFELIAKYGSNTVHGVELTFTTRPLEKPTVTTGAASAPGETEATLNGTVNPGGEATEYWFEYGTTNTYGSKTEKKSLSASGNDQSVAATLTKLVPGTEYHFRLVAKNALEEVHGLDQMFTTTSRPLPPTTTTTSTTTTTPPPTTTTTTTPLVEPPPGPPLTGGPSLRSSQRGTSVKGSLDVSQTGAGGRLEVDLLAKSASLARRGHSKPVTVGRLVRTSVSAGKVSFSVALNARGKSALHRHHRLALSVKITLMPPQGATVSIMRSVVVHA